MKNTKKTKKNNHPDYQSASPLIQKLAVFGIILSSMTLVISLFCYFYFLSKPSGQKTAGQNVSNAETQVSDDTPHITNYQYASGSESIPTNESDERIRVFGEADPSIKLLDEPVSDEDIEISDDSSDTIKSADDESTASDEISAETSEVTEELETEEIPYAIPSQELGDVSDLSADNTGTAGTEPQYYNKDSLYMAMLDTAMGPMMYYNQGDKRWGNYLYGGADPMKKYGCGPTAVAMIIGSFSPQGYNLTPVDMADWASANGGYAPQSGSYHSMIPKSLSAFGLHVEGVEPYSEKTAAELLRSGHVLVALMGEGALTRNGHFVVITKILDNGNVYIADPNSFDNSIKEWNLAQLMNELKGTYDSGGPLWAVSYK